MMQWFTYGCQGLLGIIGTSVFFTMGLKGYKRGSKNLETRLGITCDQRT
jgi:hypothetical protein